MTSNTAAPPVALNQDNIPDDLICSICMTVPAEPRITPCDHLFCKPCIRQALNQNNICPIDRRPCTHRQLKRMEGISFRVWSSIQVKCGGHDSGCAWRGSISDYAAHTQNCTVSRALVGRNTINGLAEQLESAKDELERTKRVIESLKEDKKRLKRKLSDAEDKIDDLKDDKKSLKQSLRDRPDLPKLFHGYYNFERGNVVQLSQLISRYLENKPDDIDSNKIYNCVRSCFTDLEKGYGDNPEHYYMDMRMLLATCLASNWFSSNQRRSIEQWNKDHFG